MNEHSLESKNAEHAIKKLIDRRLTVKMRMAELIMDRPPTMADTSPFRA